MSISPHRFMYLSLLIIVLAACQTNPVVPPVETVPGYSIMVLPADARMNPALLFGRESIADMAVYRQIGGGASKVFSGFVPSMNEVMHGTVGETFLFSHVELTRPYVGNSEINARFLTSKDIMDPAQGWIQEYVASPDSYYGLELSLPSYIDSGARKGTAFVVNQVTGEIVPVIRWENGKIVEKITASSWEAFLSNKAIPIPGIPVENLTPTARMLVERNAIASASVYQMEGTAAARNAYSVGMPLTTITTKLDWANAIRLEKAFTVTALEPLGMTSAEDAVSQLGFALKQGYLTGDDAVAIAMLVDSTDMPVMIDALNADDAVMALVKNPEWAGGIVVKYPTAVVAEGAVDFYYLRHPNMALTRLYVPISGGSGQAVAYRQIAVEIPMALDEAAVAESFARAGTPVSQSTVRAMLPKIGAYAGKVLRIALIGAEWGLNIYGAYVLVNEIGEAIFTWGPSYTIPVSYAQPTTDPVLFDRIWGNPYLNQEATMSASYPLNSLWLELQERALRGQYGVDGCMSLVLGLSAEDGGYPTPIVVCSGEQPLNPGDPQSMVFYNVATSEQITVPFETQNGVPDWYPPAGSLLSWPLETLDDQVTCSFGMTFGSAPIAANTGVICNWK